jgi:hypothetical protein
MVVPASPAAWAVCAQPPTSRSARAVVGGLGGAQPGGRPSLAPQPSTSGRAPSVSLLRSTAGSSAWAGSTGRGGLAAQNQRANPVSPAKGIVCCQPTRSTVQEVASVQVMMRPGQPSTGHRMAAIARRRSGRTSSGSPRGAGSPYRVALDAEVGDVPGTEKDPVGRLGWDGSARFGLLVPAKGSDLGVDLVLVREGWLGEWRHRSPHSLSAFWDATPGTGYRQRRLRPAGSVRTSAGERTRKSLRSKYACGGCT